MTKDRDRLLQAEVLRHLDAIQRWGSGGKGQLMAEPMRRSAVEHEAELLAEAATKVRQRTKQLNPDVPWALLRSLRRDLAHPYDEGAEEVSVESLWRFVRDEVPPLYRRLRRLRIPT